MRCRRPSWTAEYVPPEVPEPIRRQLRVPDGVRDIPVAEIRLDRPRINAVAGQLETAGILSMCG